MLFKILKIDFSPKKVFVFLSYFFFFGRSKGAYTEWHIETSRSAIFRGVKGSRGLWRNMVARPGCLDAILLFLLKTTRFESWPAQAIVMSIQPY